MWELERKKERKKEGKRVPTRYFRQSYIPWNMYKNVYSDTAKTQVTREDNLASRISDSKNTHLKLK